MFFIKKEKVINKTHRDNIHLNSIINKDPLLILIIFLAVFFTIIFSIYSILKLYSLSASAWDLGLESQIMFNTLHGKLFYSNLLGTSLLQEHFSPFVFIILGIYSIYPGPSILLILQASFVSFAVIPLYLFGTKFMELKIKNPTKILKALLVLVVIGYFFSPYTQGLIFFDFHIMSFLPFFFFLSFYAFIKGKRLLNVISLAFIVSLHSNFIFISAMIIVTEYLFSKMYLNDAQTSKVKNQKNSISGSNQSKISIKTISISFVILLTYVIFASYIKSLFLGTGVIDLSLQTGEVGGYSSVTGLLHGIVSNPIGVISLLSQNSSQKLFLIYYGFSSGGFLSFLSPIVLISSIPYILYAFLSTNTAYYALGYQYPAMFLPPIFISAIVSVISVPKFVKKISFHKHKELSYKITVSVIFILLVGGIMTSATVDPISTQPLYRPVDAFSTYHTPNVDGSTKAIVFLSNNINRSASILTQNNLFPFFSTFINAYSTPWSPGVNNTTANNFEFIVGEYGNPWINSFQGSEPSIYSLISEDLQNKTYGIYLESDNIIAIKKGYTGLPVYGKLLTNDFNGTNLHVDKGTVLKSGLIEASNVKNAFVWNGPYINLFPGSYNVSFKLSIMNFSINNFLELDVSSYSGANILFNFVINSSTTSLHYFNVNASISLSQPTMGVEFRGYGNFAGTVYLNHISLKQET